MRITKSQIRRIIKEEKAKILKEMANQEQDFVVGGYSGGYSSNSVRHDYIVSAMNKNEAKRILKAVKPHLRKINATPVTDYTQFNPYSTFKRLGESVNFSRGAQAKITENQLRRIIREAIDVMNQDTGEILSFSDDPADIPEKAWPDLAKRLGLNPSDRGRDASGNQSYELDHDEFMRLDNETRSKQDSRARKRKSAQMTADRERLNIDNLLQRLSDWAADAGRDYMADNPGVDMQDVAYDLADAWKFEFNPDERKELLWHFDGNLNDLKVFAAESMG